MITSRDFRGAKRYAMTIMMMMIGKNPGPSAKGVQGVPQKGTLAEDGAPL